MERTKSERKRIFILFITKRTCNSANYLTYYLFMYYNKEALLIHLSRLVKQDMIYTYNADAYYHTEMV